MRVLPPLAGTMAITEAMLISSTAAEPGPGETTYNPATTYALDAIVVSPTTHHKYRSLQANNVGKPLPVAPEKATAWWQDLGASNKWAMFDLLRNTATEVASPLTWKITPGVRFNAIALRGVVADSATITVDVGGVQVYSHTENLITREVADWYDYYFAEFTLRPSLILFDLPVYSNASVTVTLTRASGNVKCAACVVGSAEYIGDVEYDAQNDTLNFSKIDRDTFGNSELLPRRNVPKTVQNIVLDKKYVNKVRALRDRLNAAPAIWFGLDDDTDGYFESLFILGIYKRFSINLSHPTEARIALELEDI